MNNFLLCSMSPKVNKNIKTSSSKKISKLALKKAFRRSSMYDKLPHTAPADVTISISDATESASAGSATLPQCTDTHVHQRNSFAIAKAELGPETSTSKLNQVKKWVDEVNANKNDLYDCNADINSCNVSIFSEVSAICVEEDKIKQNVDTSSVYLTANSTFVDNRDGFRFEEMFHKRTKSHSDNEEEINNDKVQTIQTVALSTEISDTTVLIDDSLNNDECLETPVKTIAQVEEHEKILDELYGHSWRLNKEKILTPSQSNDFKKLHVQNKIYPKSEMKPKTSNTHKNPYLFNEICKSNNLLRTLHVDRIQKSAFSWRHRFEDICDSDSSIESLSSKQTKTKYKVKLNFDDSCSGDEEPDLNKHLIKNIKIDDDKDFDVDNTGNFEEKVNKSEHLAETSLLSSNKISCFNKHKNFGNNEMNSDKRIIPNKKVASLDSHEKKKNERTEKTCSTKKKFIKPSTILNNSNDLLVEKKCVFVDNVEIENPKSNMNIDSNSETMEEYFKKLLKTAKAKNRMNLITSDDEREATESFLKSLSGCTPLDRCHPSARIYRNTYKTSKTELAKKLFHLYNENIFNNSIPTDTPLEWNDRMRGTAGFCYCRRVTRSTGATERTVRIVLATKILDSADRLRDTLVHEMCHAATWILNEISDGHGPFWKACNNKISQNKVQKEKFLTTKYKKAVTVVIPLVKSISSKISTEDGNLVAEIFFEPQSPPIIGTRNSIRADKAMKTFPELPRIKRCHDYKINTKYTYKCSDCGYCIGRHSKSLDVERKRCGYCYGKFETFINKVTKNGVQSVTPVTPKKELAGFALYVKENYGSVKKENMKHADVMRSLSKQFNGLKTK